MGGIIISRVPQEYSRNPDREEFGTMSANVHVAGLQNDGMGGLKESTAKFRKHHKDVGDALLNISGVDTVSGGPVDKDEPRPTYHRQEFPKMIYHAEKGEYIVGDKAELDEYLADGWRKEPYSKPKVVVLDPAVEKKAVMDENARRRGQLATQGDILEKLAARLEAMEQASKPERKKSA